MKKILIALALCLLMVGLIASPAFAAPTKYYLYQDNNTSTLSYATFTVQQGDNAVTVNVRLIGAAPLTTYKLNLYLNSAKYGYQGPLYLGTVTTNVNGNWAAQNSQGNFEQPLPRETYTAYLELVNGTSGILSTYFGGLATFKIKN
jgi:hypothetical protein